MRIHRNLHNARRGGPQWVSTVRGKVDAYLDFVALENVTTRIQPAGQRKCQESGVRSVCAFFDGDAVSEGRIDTGTWQLVSYDPRVDSCFQATDMETGEKTPWNRADVARLDTNGSTWVLRPTFEEK